MVKLNLYKFIIENCCEFHWVDEQSDVVMFVDFSDIEEFAKMLGADMLDEGGIQCHLVDGHLVFDMREICEAMGIELEDVFGKKEKENG